MDKKEFDTKNIFGQGQPNTDFAQYFIDNSYLNPLVDPKETSSRIIHRLAANSPLSIDFTDFLNFFCNTHQVYRKRPQTLVKLRCYHKKIPERKRPSMDIVNTLRLNSNTKIEINFDGGELSSDSGLFLMKEFLDKIGFDKILRECFATTDAASYRRHSDIKNLLQAMYQIFAGYFADDRRQSHKRACLYCLSGEGRSCIAAYHVQILQPP